MRRAMVLCSLAVLVIAGCAKHSMYGDREFAQKVVEAVYAGSLAPIQTNLSPTIGLDDAWAQKMSDTLKPEFGAIKEVKLNSFGQKKDDLQEVIWTVTTENSTFLMQLMWNKDDKVQSIQFNY